MCGELKSKEKEKNNPNNVVQEDKVINNLNKDISRTNDGSINNAKVNTSIDDITDDEFFDDFFNDED